MTHSLEVRRDTELVFSSDGKWLHPLFELETFLSASPVNPAELSLADTVIGRAAAMLILRLGIRTVYGKIMSALALETFRDHGVEPRYGELVDRIACRTEELLEHSVDIEAAYLMLRERAAASKNRPTPA